MAKVVARRAADLGHSGDGMKTRIGELREVEGRKKERRGRKGKERGRTKGGELNGIYKQGHDSRSRL